MNHPENPAISSRNQAGRISGGTKNGLAICGQVELMYSVRNIDDMSVRVLPVSELGDRGLPFTRVASESNEVAWVGRCGTARVLTSCSRGLSSTTFSGKVGKIGDGLSLIPRSVTSSASLSTLLVAGLPGTEFAENLKSENLSEATKRVGNTIVARFWVSCVSSGTYANPTDFKSFFDRDREWVLDDMFFWSA